MPQPTSKTIHEKQTKRRNKTVHTQSIEIQRGVKNMTEDKPRSKEQYTKEQIRRCIDNLVTILEISEQTIVNLDQTDIEEIYCTANDSLVRLEGITHYPER